MWFRKGAVWITVAFISTGVLFTACQQTKTDVSSLKEEAYPVEPGQTLHYWIPNLAAVDGYTKRSDLPITKELEKRTGIDVEWILPTRGQEQQQFNILLASGDVPDVVEWRWPEYTGGPEKALEDGIITPLNELEEYIPNFYQAVTANQDFEKMSKTDSGRYYYFPVLRDVTQPDGYTLVVSSGYMMRQDWLEELKLPVPETIEEWHTTLTAFKERKGAEAPLSLTLEDMGSGLVGAYGLYMDFYQEDGVVKYGRIDPRYKDFLTEMKRWYDEGLIDKNFATIDYELVGERIVNDKAGAAFGWLGGQMGTWTTQAQQINPEFKLVGVPFPTLHRGDTVKFTPKEASVLSQGGAAISGKSIKKELAAKFMDYFYSEEGHMLANFGVEGDTYTMQDGYPAYTDKILHNPDGLSVGQALSLYTRATAPGPYQQDSRYSEQYYQLPEQKAAQEIWKNTKADQYRLPTIMPTIEEGAEYSAMISNIKAYADEMFLKFIFGEEPIENFEKYVYNLKAMGIDRVLEIQQAGLERYQNR